MPKNDAPKFYWDSCVFLSAIDAHPERAPIITQLLDECTSGKHDIFTSHLSIAEVCFAKTEKVAREINLEVEEKIAKLWNEESPVKMVEVHEVVARNAIGLIRQALSRGFGLKPADAIHLATAKLWNVEEFHTYDEKLFKYAGVMGFRIVMPYLDQLLIYPPDTSPIHRLRDQQWYWRDPPPRHPNRPSRYVPVRIYKKMHRL